jgi:Holliday junction resolvase RusA-like endonuclease
VRGVGRFLMGSVTFWTEGTPVGQGAVSFYGKGRAAHSNDKTLKPWRREIASSGQKAMHDQPPIEGPVLVRLSFYLPRPKTVKRLLPHVYPDLDHLVRAFGDAVKGVVVVDDAQIVKSEAQKLYATGKAGLWAEVVAL